MEMIIHGFNFSVTYIVPIALLLIIAYQSIVNVGGKEIALVERRWFGKKMPQGRVVAQNDEVGIQARTLGPGLHFLIPFLYKAIKSEFTEIHDGQIGLVESVDGVAVPSGRIFAAVVTGHNSFQDGEAFLANNGEKGPQIEILPPGKYRINPYLFKVTVAKATIVPQGQIGIVTSQDGVPITNRLLAKSIKNHSNFEDGAAFLAGGGEKGPQIDILTPGTYRINLNLFNVKLENAIIIDADRIGLVTALDGQPLPDGEFVAKQVSGHNDYQNASAFIEAGGQRGPQLDVLKPGTYYINPFMFEVELDLVAVVERGEVAVVVSNVGEEPTEEMKRRLGSSQLEATEEEGKEKYVVPKGYRGIQEEVAGPGRYYLNCRAYIPYIIDTTNITIDWDEKDETRFDQLTVISKDGFPIQVSVKVVIRVRPDQAPYMVAKVGSTDNLIQHVIHPMIDSSFRNQASTASAMNFLQSRSEEQTKAENRARADLERYHVECVSVLICQIRLPEELMETQTKRIIAEQQQEMFKMEQKSQAERTEMEKMRATADQQPTLVASEIAVKVATQKKTEMITLAEGRAEEAKLQGIGEGERLRVIGEGEAAKIEAIGKATAQAYEDQKEAIGQDAITTIKITELVMTALEKGNIKIVPDIQVNGSSGSGMLDAVLAKFLNGNVLKL